MKNSNYVQSLISIFGEVGNPFADTRKDLYTLITKQIMPDNVKAAVDFAKDIDISELCLRTYSFTTAFTDVILKNNLLLFSYSSVTKVERLPPRNPT